MAVYKEEKTNTWRAVYRYTDWNGERKQTQKRGFKTKRGGTGMGAGTAQQDQRRSGHDLQEFRGPLHGGY